MKFDVIGQIEAIEVIALGSSIRELSYLQKVYGIGRWRKLKGTAQIKLPNGRIRNVELHWYEAHGIGRKDMKIKCYVDNTDYEASLIIRKIYEVLPDEEAAKDEMLRVIDESGEDYLYHRSQFIIVEFPAEVQQALTTV